METTVDSKVRRILRELIVAVQDYSQRFIVPVLSHNERAQNHDFFELALAQDKVNLLETQYKLAWAEESPEQFSEQAKEFLKKEEERLTKRIRAWENRQFPSREG